MTDETTAAAPAQDDNLAKAIANGYQAPAAPTREARIAALIEGYQQALDHNGPRTEAELAEIKALLGA